MWLTPSPLCLLGTPLLIHGKPAQIRIHADNSTRNAGRGDAKKGALLKSGEGGMRDTPPH